jgi:hypothetical protein
MLSRGKKQFMNRALSRSAVVALVGLAAACASARKEEPEAREVPASAGSSSAASSEWRSLIDPSLSAWRGYRQQTLPPVWHVVDGTLTKDVSTNELVSRDEFDDFELVFDWRLEPGGNAGVFYRGTEQEDKIYWTGTEYQLLDDARHPDGRNRLTSAGAAYGIYAPPAGVVKPAGEWNSSRIVARGDHVEHWMNGQKLLEYDFGSPEWSARVAASKFKAWPNYGKARRGHIGIQGDHAGVLSIRNMRIRTLQ